MLRSMYTAISGLRNHQVMLDTTANNIANVNTYGFKASNVAFKTLLSQTMQGAGQPAAQLGGTNPIQVGLGMTVDSITQRFTQGGLQTTGVGTDLAIQGDGFFQTTNDMTNINTGTEPAFYTRAGNFKWDAGDPAAAPRMSRLVTSDGQFVIGYLDWDAATAGFQLDTSQPPVNPGAQGFIQFDPTTQSDPRIGADGSVVVFDNTVGTDVKIAQIKMARFSNPSGLTAVGNNRWIESLNSGIPVCNVASTNGLGQISVGYLEMSNVDLATEFTEMIKAQRGFQANSRVITTSDEILQELVNLKR